MWDIMGFLGKSQHIQLKVLFVKIHQKSESKHDYLQQE
tara:strand:+ start:428 stop:541 length:114 start_codon:yes stop_codon:yes gene_type:complete